MTRCASLLLLLQASCSAPGVRSFDLDGETIHPEILSMEGTPEQPRPGDVLLLHLPHYRPDGHVSIGPSTPVALGDEVNFTFRTSPDRPGVLFLDIEGGPTRIIAVKVYSEGEAIVNPLKDLSEEEIHGLRAIDVTDWSPDLVDLLQQADPERVCISLRNSAVKALRMVPRTLQKLKVESPCFDSLSQRLQKELSTLTELRWLAWSGEIDAHTLRSFPKLQYLDLESATIDHPQSLASLTHLRALRLAWASGVTRVDFLTSLQDLRVLDVTHTQIEDLSPAGGLRQLAQIVADESPIRTLMQREMPALRQLDVRSTPLAEREVSEFRRRNPQCRIRHLRMDLFRQAVRGTDRIRVRTNVRKGDSTHQTLFEVAQPDEVRKVLVGLAIDETRGSFHDFCDGTESFEFYNGKTLLGTLNLHHGSILTWRRPREWPDDAELTQESGDFLVRWLADHGVPEPQQERARSRK